MTAEPRKLRMIRIAASLLLLVACVALAPSLVRNRLQAARRHWKNEAIAAIAHWAMDANWRTQEIGVLTNGSTNQQVLGEGWLTDKMMLMANGEWLVYQSHCSKAPPHLVKDIFLAKGSDGKWYYSTFHFCVGMCAFLMEQETQPTNLAMVVHEYNLREFDGQSDDCLKETRPWPASWYENRPPPP